MPNMINSNIPEADITLVEQSLDTSISRVKPHFDNLTNAQKTGIRTMSTNREGLARLVDGIANANIDSIARNLNPADLTAKLAYKDSLVRTVQKLNTLVEMITEINIANGVDIMKLVDTISDNLQTSRENNGALDLAMAPVDEWNKRFAHTEDTPPVGGNG